MKYHAPTQQFTVSTENLKHASYALRNAIKHIRTQAKRDTMGYENHGPMDNAEFAESSILDAARMLGIDLGSECPGKLDVSDA